MDDHESFFVISTGGKEYKYRMLPEDVELARRMFGKENGRKGNGRKEKLVASVLDYFSLLISLFDKQPVENIPTVWGRLYTFKIVGVGDIAEINRVMIPHSLFIESYLKSRGVKFPAALPYNIANDAKYQNLIDKEKKLIGKDKYKILYKRLYEIIG